VTFLKKLMKLSPAAANRETPGWQLNKPLANAIGRRITAASATIMALLALSPVGWTRELGAWTHLLVRFRVALLGILVAYLAVRLILARQPFISRLEYMAPAEYRGIPDMTPHGIQARLTGVLENVDGPEPGKEHVVRIVLLTGGATLHYLEQVVDMYATRSNWDIRVLIVDPGSPDIQRLGPGAKEQVLASCARLASMQERIVLRRRPARISWRGYFSLPMIRGLSIDNDHLFFGYFVWSKHDNEWRLIEQNKRLIYARRGDQLSQDSIDFFDSWFDYEWSKGHVLDGTSRI
jgi:hypothetical protein